MRKQYVPLALKQQITKDANQRCGYCLSQQRLVGSPMTVEHLLPESKGGTTTRNNLWLACRRCNEFRGNRTEALDNVSGVIAAYLIHVTTHGKRISFGLMMRQKLLG